MSLLKVHLVPFDLRKLEGETKSVAKMSVLLLALITSQVGNCLPNFNRGVTPTC
jgi:hypothetical protein